MKKQLLVSALSLSTLFATAQTDLITNGSFEDATSPWTGWSSTIVNGELWAGQGSGCSGGSDGTDYAWSGDQTESSGYNGLSENMFQTVTIPSNSVSATLYFDASVNTTESGSTAWDEMEVTLESSNGTFLTSLGGLDNTDGDFGIPGCQTWGGYFVAIPQSYWGQNIRVVFTFSTDGSNPTIFRIDNVELLVSNQNCTYNLSTNNVTLPDHTAGSGISIANVTTQSGCNWTATVTSGSSWLSTTSSGSGSGSVAINVTENTTGSARTGSINVEGQTLTINQPAFACTYSVSTAVYNVADFNSGTFSNIAIVNTNAGCNWSAAVQGSAVNWIVCNSNGNGSGTIDITVLENTTDSARVGIIQVETETLLVVQPVNPSLTSLDEVRASEVNIYPNPTDGLLFVESDDVTPGTPYRITSLTGATLISGRTTDRRTTINTESLSSGYYLLELDDKSPSKHKILIK